MLRNKVSSSMQKTYDDCYLICSTAVYFEGQVTCTAGDQHEIQLTQLLVEQRGRGSQVVAISP